MGGRGPYSIVAIFQGNFEQSLISITSLLWNEWAACVLLILFSLDDLQDFKEVLHSCSLYQELWELLILQTPREFRRYLGDVGPVPDSNCDVLGELKKVTALVFSFLSDLFRFPSGIYFVASVGQVAPLQQILY